MQEDALLSYHASDMVLAVHSAASYLSKPKARSQAGGHFFLSSNTTVPPNNGAILNIVHIIKNVMSSATEAELTGLYIMACEPKQTKTMDMRFHWLCDWECQQQFRIYWQPSKLNYANYWTKHHPETHHCYMRKEFLLLHIVFKI
jgi:hypothetical protein